MEKAEVVVVLGRIDNDAVWKCSEDESKHRCRIGDCEGHWTSHLLDICLVGFEPRQLRTLSGRAPNKDSQRCYGNERNWPARLVPKRGLAHCRPPIRIR